MEEIKAKYGLYLMSSVLKDSVEHFLNLDLREDLFVGSDEVDFYKYVDKFVLSHGSMPKKSTIKDELGVEIPKSVEPSSYYNELVEKRFYHRSMKQNIGSALELLNDGKPLEATDHLIDKLLAISKMTNRKQLVEVTEDGKSLLKSDYTKNWGLFEGCQMGWPSLDNMTKGLDESDLISIIGRPGSGKTYLSVYSAHHMWDVQGKVVLFVSMEMKPINILKRIMAIHTHRDYNYFKDASYGDIFKKQLWTMFDDMQADVNRKPFHIVDGNLTSNVKSILQLVKQLKPDVVIVDGAYLLKPDGAAGFNKVDKISSTIEGLKEHIVGGCSIPVIASYQFNRDSTKVKDDQVGLEHIAGSDAIGQISSVVLGLFGDQDNVEETTKKEVMILKGRNGERGSFKINWRFSNFPFMDFTEVPEKEQTKKLNK